MGAIHSDISPLINAFIHESDAAGSVLSRQFDLPILTEHVENALVEALHLESSVELLDSHWTRNDILSALRGFNFHRLFPVFLIQITLDTSLIPQGAQRSLVEQTVKCKGEIWRVYRNDADPFPSNPHAHNLASGYKLHLGTGELFLKRRFMGKVPRKRLQAIRMLLSNLELPELAF